ncbi:sulfotransferase domain-containing protein [Solwaraspora sp. WMMB335]|uniref:sulfotransferase domain-containing protein n=1 Tax=Solwaraspora sp. WMMB335 TaxID=3404118 RepID=UPI003B9620C6
MGEAAVRVIFIGGVGRSGSTVVERILNELPGVCGLGEVAQVWQNGVRDNRLCGCGAAFHDCAVWREIGQRAFGGWHSVDLDRIRLLRDCVGRTRHVPRLARRQLNPTVRARVTEYVDFYTRIYSAAAAVTGAHTVVDSSKHVGQAFCLRWASDLDLRVLHLVRDPRGVAHSWTKQVHDPESGGPVQVPRYPVTRCALSWNTNNAAFDLLARLSPQVGRPGAGQRAHPVHRMRYEEFLADPAGAVTALAGFAGLDVTGAELSYLDGCRAHLGTVHAVSGNRMRFTQGAVTLRVDDAWHTALAPTRRRLVGALCAPLLLAYGCPRQFPAANPAAPPAADCRVRSGGQRR